MDSKTRRHRQRAVAAEKTIVFVIPDMVEGGAERVTAILTDHFARHGWRVHLLIEHAPQDVISRYPLHPEVICHHLNSASLHGMLPKTRTFRMYYSLRQTISHCHPSIVIAIMDSTAIRTLLATVGLPIPIIVTEHCDPHTRPLSPVKSWLRRWLYPRAASVVALTDTAMRFFPPAIQARGTIIPNPAMPPPPEILALRQPERTPRTILSIGRLEQIKGYDRLIAAFARIAPQHPDWMMEIWGEGAEHDTLQRQAREAGLAERLTFPGRTVDPYATLMHADLFVLSSWTEGFPMALIEAMACGVPVISFNCPSGPRHIIRHDVDGVLVADGDVNALAAAMNRLMSDQQCRHRMSQRAREITERFAYQQIMRQWEELIQCILQGER